MTSVADALAGMTLATPLALLLAIPLAVLLAARLRPERPAHVMADLGPLVAAARPTLRMRLRRLPDVLRALAILLLVISIARPREGLAVTVLPEDGIDVVAVVDVSSSMQAQVSSSETRLDAARRVLDEFAGTLRGDRLGLVAFQSRALTLSPLTSDVRAIQRRIDQLKPGLISDGTAIGLGMMEGIALLRDSPAKSRVIVLLTDGSNNSGEVGPFEAARVAEVLGIRVYTIGITSSGRFAATLDSRGLAELAEVTGGQFFNAATAEELEAAYDEIGSLERSRVGERRFVSFREYGPWLALAAAALLMMDLGLRSTWLRRQP
jgi:Ca-activated chloride channel homolog